MPDAIARAVTQRLVDIAGHPLTVLALTILTATSALWAVVSPSMSSFTLFLSVLAILLTAAVLFVQRQSEEAMHAKLSELVRAVPEADDALIGIEKP